MVGEIAAPVAVVGAGIAAAEAIAAVITVAVIAVAPAVAFVTVTPAVAAVATSPVIATRAPVATVPAVNPGSVSRSATLRHRHRRSRRRRQCHDQRPAGEGNEDLAHRRLLSATNLRAIGFGGHRVGRANSVVINGALTHHATL